MNKHTINKYVRLFEKKHSVNKLQFDTQDADVFKFDDERFYSLNDIIYDIDNEVPVGQIENYSDIGTESAVSLSFKTWYGLKLKQQ